MNKLLGCYICVTGILLAFRLDMSTVVCDVTALVVLGGAVHYLALRRFWDNFWPMLFGVFFGPLLIAAILRTLYVKTVTFLFSTFGRFTIPILCLGIVAISGLSFLYVRSQVRRFTRRHRKDDSLEERRPVLTILREKVEELCGYKESESSNDSSDED
jgi:hypothetical protein